MLAATARVVAPAPPLCARMPITAWQPSAPGCTTFVTCTPATVPEASRSAYAPHWVDKLYRACARNLSALFRFVCVTDRDKSEFKMPVEVVPFIGKDRSWMCLTECLRQDLGIERVHLGHVDGRFGGRSPVIGGVKLVVLVHYKAGQCPGRLGRVRGQGGEDGIVGVSLAGFGFFGEDQVVGEPFEFVGHLVHGHEAGVKIDEVEMDPRIPHRFGQVGKAHE